MLDVAGAVFPRPLAEYPATAGQSLGQILAGRVEIEPFNAVATAIFAAAILHTFAAARFTAIAERLQHQHEREAREQERPVTPSVRAELMHFLGEVEVVFGLWAV